MPDWLLTALRGLVRAGLAAAALWLAAQGLPVPEVVSSWVELAVLTAAIAAWTAAQRWLESREGDDPMARLARGIARAMMLGLGYTRPVYVAPGDRVQLRADSTVIRR